MSDTPPSIPPRKTPAQSSTKTGSTPAVSKPASSSGTSTASTTRPATGRTPAAARSGAATTTASTAGTATATPAAAARPSTPAAAPSPTPAAAEKTPARPAAASTPAPAAASSSTGPRRVRLAVSRVDPWSVMKLSFLMSVAAGIMLVVATVVVWLTLDGQHDFSTINNLATEILADTDVDIMQYIELNRVASVATLIAVVDVFLITALATIGAFLYNITAALVGGVHVTMTDD
jgi:hypothetical protein